jgi:hypothetical protein
MYSMESTTHVLMHVMARVFGVINPIRYSVAEELVKVSAE